jgi:hypothetical protein
MFSISEMEEYDSLILLGQLRKHDSTESPGGQDTLPDFYNSLWECDNSAARLSQWEEEDCRP